MNHIPLPIMLLLGIALILTASCTLQTQPASSAIQTQNEQPGDHMTTATIETTYGTIKVKLYDAKAPITVQNFKSYAQSGFYDGTVFHRVIPNFMVQTGGFLPNGTEKDAKAPIKNEAKNGLHNTRGTLAMARTNVVDSASSQFFINVKDNAFLNYQSESNYGYAVFGEVTEGMGSVDKIVSAPTASRGPYDDWPVQDIIIKSVTIDK